MIAYLTPTNVIERNQGRKFRYVRKKLTLKNLFSTTLREHVTNFRFDSNSTSITGWNNNMSMVRDYILSLPTDNRTLSEVADGDSHVVLVGDEIFRDHSRAPILF